MGATVIFECPEKLMKLFEGVPGIDILFPHGTEAPPHDVHAALLSLPGLVGTTLGGKSEIRSPKSEGNPKSPIQNPKPDERAKLGLHIAGEATDWEFRPYLQAEPARVARWERELAAYPEFKVGIHWQGNPGFAGDFHRSMALRHFAPLARVPGVRLFSLQKFDGSEQLKELAGAFPVIDLGCRLNEGPDTAPFLDTAAVMKCLDLVVSSDTAAVHVAGALSVPVWVPLSASAGWQWMHARDDSPWYPTMRLFRQERLLDWPPVFERIAAALRAIVRPTPTARSVPIEVAPGELIDKLTILEIKIERIGDAKKLVHVRHERELLAAALDRALIPSAELKALRAELKAVNEALWQAEDAICDCNRGGDFGPEFAALAQSVYRSKDQRAALKRRINELLGAEVLEEKSYDAVAPHGDRAEPVIDH
jgi:hypothetical protein